MSSQSTDFPPVSFSTRYPRKSLRLLELPHELVATIEEGRKIGSATRMQLKSTSTSQGYLHLCTDEKMWAVKQVSTSNSVYVTESTGAGDERRSNKRRKIEHEKEGDQMDVDHEHQKEQYQNGEMTAISQVKNILELIHVDTDSSQVETMIKDMLPIYHNADDDDDDDDVGRYSKNQDRCIRMEDLLGDIPAPDKAILDAARKLFVFGVSEGRDDKPAFYLPTSSLLLRAWKSFMQTYTLSSFKSKDWNDVKSWIGPVLADMKQSNIDDDNESDLLTSVVMASLRRFAILQKEGTKFQPSHKTFTTMPPEIAGWNGGEGCASVGQWLLESLLSQNRSRTTRTVLSVEEFKQQWEQILPESWAKDCDVVSLVKSSSVDVEVVIDDQGKEVLKLPTITPRDDRGRIVGVNKGAGIAAGAATTATGVVNDAKAQKKRKWHEKFGAQRNSTIKK